jgi:hypothetical protein
VVPATHVPDPVQPIPAHCDRSARFPAGAVLVVADADVEVDLAVPVAELAVVFFVALAEEELTLTTTPPGTATLVVNVPFSI